MNTKYLKIVLLVCTSIVFNFQFSTYNSARAQDSVVVVDLPEGQHLELVWVEGGSFTMGSNSARGVSHNYEASRPEHSVTVDGFFMGRLEVTQGVWKAVMGENPSKFSSNDSLPVEQVLWADAQQFVTLLSQMTGRRFRLPTEAEWEFAARGGVKSNGTIFPGTAKNLNDVGWYCVNSENITHPVGRKLPNELGLYDMAGNVLEWCSDWYGSYTESPQVNPRGPRQGDSRIQRGGCINSPSWGCAVSDRNWYLPDRGYGFCGFRLVLDSIEEPVPDDEY